MSHIYRIRIGGQLDSSWVEWFDGFTLTHQPDGTTILVGNINDQPALQGLLTKIYNLGMPLLLVEQIETTENSF
ncbi:MAG: hypothetical protein GY805_32140 [Chloroflexi bacterium]|nr:hypothetical protein [Chloroflexota bacterium]